MRERRVLVFGQSLVKPRCHGWPVFVPGKFIDEYLANKEIGYCKTLEQAVDGVKFFIHCQKEDKYVTKIMLCHDVLTDVEDRETCQEVVREDGQEEQSTSNTPSPFPDTTNKNNGLMTPTIADMTQCISCIRRTKCWPNRQFTLILQVVKANASNARICSKK